MVSRTSPMYYVDQFTILIHTSERPFTLVTLRQFAAWSQSVGKLWLTNESLVRDCLHCREPPLNYLDFQVHERFSMEALIAQIAQGLCPLKAHISAVNFHCYRDGDKLRVPFGKSREQLWPTSKQ